MKIDTGEKLDVVYTTDSLLVVIPTGTCSAMVISKVRALSTCSILSDEESVWVVTQLVLE